MKIKRMKNNCFVKEICIVCKNIFKADLDVIYLIQDIGYICYECAEKDFIKEVKE
jgi:hypothetical protein